MSEPTTEQTREESSELPTDVLGAQLRWRAVLGVIIAAAMTVMDLIMTSTALGDIQHDLGFSLPQTALVISASATTELVTLALSAYLTRIFPPRTYLLGLCATFVLGAMISANAWNMSILLVGRVVQGAASGAIMPFAYYLVVALMRKDEQPRAIAAFSFTVTASGVLGPILSITIAQWISWRALFYASVPVAVVALALALPGLGRMPVPKSLLGRRVSVLSVGAVALGLFFLQFTFDGGDSRGWYTSPTIWASTAIALVALGVFVGNELRGRHPLVDLRLLRNRPLLVSCVLNVLAGAATYGAYFLIPFYLTAHGYSVGRIGAVTLYGGLVQLVVALRLPSVLRRVNPMIVAGGGAALFAGSGLLPLLAGNSPAAALIIAAQMLRAVGAGVLLASLGLMMTRALTPADASSGSLLFNLARSLGGSVGTALCSAFIVWRESHFVATGVTRTVARFDALHDTLLVAVTALALLSAGLIVAQLRQRRARGSAAPA